MSNAIRCIQNIIMMEIHSRLFEDSELAELLMQESNDGAEVEIHISDDNMDQIIFNAPNAQYAITIEEWLL